MSTLGVKSALARAVVDPKWRKKFVADMENAINKAGYDVTADEIAAIKVTEECLSEPSVNMETFEHFWRITEEKNLERLSMLSGNNKISLAGTDPVEPLCFGG